MAELRQTTMVAPRICSRRLGLATNTLKLKDTIQLIVGMDGHPKEILEIHLDSLKLELWIFLATKNEGLVDCFTDRAQTKVSVVLSAAIRAAFDGLHGLSAFTIANNEL